MWLLSGGSEGVLRSPWPVVWRKRPGWRQELHLSRRGWLSDWLHGHLRRQSRQPPDPAPRLRQHAPVERGDLQRPLLSGRSPPLSCSVNRLLMQRTHPDWTSPGLPQVYVQTQGAPSLTLSICRDEYPSSPLVLRGINSQGAPSQQYQPVLMMSKSYTLHWSGPAPREVVLSLINFDK